MYNWPEKRPVVHRSVDSLQEVRDAMLHLLSPVISLVMSDR